MSLLLEALKKAELAKRVAKGEAPSPELKPAPPEPTKPVMTRERLPDITQPLEILSDDLPSSETKAAEPAAARPELSLQEQETFEPAAQPTLSTNEFARTAERAQAQQLFQVKEMDYNPRRPFYLSLGALALVGLSYAGYVWWQLRPPPWQNLPNPPQRLLRRCKPRRPLCSHQRAPQFRESLRYSRCVRGPNRPRECLPRGLRRCGPNPRRSRPDPFRRGQARGGSRRSRSMPPR